MGGPRGKGASWGLRVPWLPFLRRACVVTKEELRLSKIENVKLVSYIERQIRYRDQLLPVVDALLLSVERHHIATSMS